ncbi:hypothetical protein [Streptomyces sp. NPDC048650]|uniref:hypothetical protein n=1 Tax=unclassified Streptomyces TaxID=2593676 RepID=UPI00371FC477
MSYPPQPGGPGGSNAYGQAPLPSQPAGPPPAAPGPVPSAPYAPPGQGPAPQGGPYPAQPWPPQAGGPPSPPPPPSGGEGKGLKRAVIGVVVLAVLAVLGIGGVAIVKGMGGNDLPGGAGGDATGEQLLSEADISGLLQGRTQALKSGDEDTFLAPFSGDARTHQKKIYQNLRKVPFAQADYRVLKQTGTGSDDYGDGATVALDVAFVHKIRNVDVQPVAEWYRWVVKRASKSDKPSITKVGGSPSAYGAKGYVYYPAPWDVYDDMFVEKQPHSLVIADKKNAAKVSRFAPHIEKAAADDVAFWASNAPTDAPTSKSFVVTVEPDRKVYSTLYTSSEKDVGWDAGMSVGMPAFSETYEDVQNKPQFGGARIKLDATAGYFSGDQWQRGVEQISHHEIAHSIVQPLDKGDYGLLAMDGGARSWVVEGFAEYIAFHFDPQQGSMKMRSGFAKGSFDGKLPDSELGSYPHSVGMDYSLAYLAIKYIEKKSGQAAALKFVADHYQNPKKLDQQLQTAVGQNTADFQAGWAKYVRSVAP